MVSPITNCWDSGKQIPKLEIERVRIYSPATEWTYSHHASITRFKEKFYAIWSNGRIDEDAPGQRVLISTSEDFTSWSDPYPLIDVLQGEHSELILTAAGFHEYKGTLTVYFGQYEYKPLMFESGQSLSSAKGHMNTCLRAVTTEDGDTWTQIREMDIPIVPNHGPQPGLDGRLIISGNISFPYTDDPSGLSGLCMAGIYPSDYSGPDDSESFWEIQKMKGWPAGLCEGSFYMTDDSVLHMLLRSGTDRLWVTESTDNGATWSEPEKTGFADNVSKFHFGRLPDGRFYYVGCPDPLTRGQRNPLVLSLSQDGVLFDNHFIIADEPYEKKREGMHKGGVYGYPHTMVYDNFLYIIVSLGKESVCVMRIDITPL